MALRGVAVSRVPILVPNFAYKKQKVIHPTWGMGVNNEHRFLYAQPKAGVCIRELAIRLSSMSSTLIYSATVNFSVFSQTYLSKPINDHEVKAELAPKSSGRMEYLHALAFEQLRRG
jgi:hypothetical protein